MWLNLLPALHPTPTPPSPCSVALLRSRRCEKNGKPNPCCGSVQVPMAAAQTRQRLVLGLLPNLLRCSTGFPSSALPHPRGVLVAAGEWRWEHRMREDRKRRRGGGKKGNSVAPHRSFKSQLSKVFLSTPPITEPLQLCIYMIHKYLSFSPPKNL